MVFFGSGRTHSTMGLIRARGVKYWPAPLLVSSAFFSQEAFVDVAFVVGAHEHPLLGVDQSDESV